MFLAILNFIEQCWLLIAGGMALIVMLFQHEEVSHLDNKLAACVAANTTLAAANAKLSQTINIQNAAIATLQTTAQAKHALVIKSLTLAKTNAEKYADHAERIKQEKVPDTCEGLIQLLDDYVKQGG